MQFNVRKSLRGIFQNGYDRDARPKDKFSNNILNSGVSHEANSHAIIGWAKVPPDFPCLDTMPIAFVWLIHSFGVRVKDVAFFFSKSSL